MKISDLAREAALNTIRDQWQWPADGTRVERLAEAYQSAINAACKPLTELADWALKRYSDCAQSCGYGGWDVEEFEKREQVLTNHRNEHGE